MSDKTEVQKYDLEAERLEIIRRYRGLLRHVMPHIKERKEIKLVHEAMRVAAKAHSHMRRKSGEPYIYHPIEVARIVVEEIGLDVTSVIAALLHDVVEDTDTTLEELAAIFGDTVANIVDGLTKLTGSMRKSKSIQAENFRKMLLTISEDVRVVLIKIADRLHNMRTLESMAKDKQLKIQAETQYIYTPVAHRLGLYNIKSELEDLCLKYENGEAYDMLVKKLQASKAARERFIRLFTRPIVESLKKQGFDENIKVKSRTKSISSIWTKMQKQQIPFEEIYDIFAIRIIVDTPFEEEKSACWKIYSTVTDFYTPSVQRLRDWISTPKSNGYESLHTTVMSKAGTWVEVQIRTKRMDEIAEKGYAAHWKYKDKGGNRAEKGIEQWISQVRDMLENSDGSAMDFMDAFRSNLFNREIYVFTPTGELKIYPAGATVLDFAFDIHSEVGARCQGAKIGGKLRPIDHVLNSGEQIEILTGNKPNANEAWLKIATTSRAKAKIKQCLREDKRIFVVEGRAIVERKLRHLKLPFNDATIAQLLEYFDLKVDTEMFYSIGIGEIDHNLIKKFHEAKEQQDAPGKKIRADSAKDLKQKMKDVRVADPKNAPATDELIIGESAGWLDYQLAKCCTPIPGDDVFGFTTISEGIKVHRTTCPNAVSLMANYGHRIMPARWASQSNSIFDVDLEITGTDRMGIVSDVTRIISTQMSVNMKALSFESDNGIFSGKISLAVHDKDEYEAVVEKLKEIDAVVNVKRVV